MGGLALRGQVRVGRRGPRGAAGGGGTLGSGRRGLGRREVRGGARGAGRWGVARHRPPCSSRARPLELPRREVNPAPARSTASSPSSEQVRAGAGEGSEERPFPGSFCGP